MEKNTLDKLLLKTAFCCMASDGEIDKKEVTIIENLCKNLSLFENYDVNSELNNYINQINENGKEFIDEYFSAFKSLNLSEDDELMILDFALKTIKADHLINYSEIKFFKIIRKHLKLSDSKILELHPDIEDYLEDDIVDKSPLKKITEHYLNKLDLPTFEKIKKSAE